VQLQKVDPLAQVIDAFRDVQAARADQERLQNEAGSYANRVVPEARGEAERILQAARAYREQTVAEATESLLPGAVRLGRRQADAVPIFPSTSGATKGLPTAQRSMDRRCSG
jgi:regulator of protease activity HflC (stomatin/prohibitin superfamily)